MDNRKTSRRAFLKLAGVAATGATLAACAPPPQAAPKAAEPAKPAEKPAAAPAAAAGGKVVIAVGGWAQDTTKEITDKLGFKESGHTVDVQVRPGGAELTAMLTAGIASGASPYDVMDFEDEAAITYSRSGYFMPLDDLLPKDFWEDFPETLMGVTKLWDQYEGKTFRIHHNFECNYHWYRKDWFDAKGVKPPETWDDVAALGKVFTDEAKGVWATEDGLTPGGLAVYQGYITNQAGGNVFAVDDKWKTALQYAHKLIYEDKAMNPASLQKDYTQQNADYTADKVAYHRQWPFFYDVARAKKDWFKEEKAVICLPPVGPGGKASSTYAAGWGFGILKTAQNMDGAQKLLQFLVDKKNAGQMAKMNTWWLSNRKSVLETVGDAGMAKYLKMYSEAGVVGARPYHPKFVEASSKLDAAASAYLTNQIDLDACVKQGQEAMKALA